MALVSLALVALCISFLQLSSGQPTPTKPVLSESFSTRVSIHYSYTYILNITIIHKSCM